MVSILHAAIGRCYRRVCRMWPIYGGEYRLTRNKLSNWIYNSHCELIETSLRNGMRITIDPSDMNGRMIDLFGSADRRVVDLCKAIVPVVDHFFDVGANYGSVGLQCVSSISNGCSIHFVEPQPILIDRIRNVVEDCELSNCILHQVCLFHADGEAELFAQRGHSGSANLFASSDVGNMLSVRVRATEPFLKEFSNGSSFGMKIDAEGASMVILEYALKLAGFKFAVVESQQRERDALFSILEAQKSLVCFGINLSHQMSLERVAPETDFDKFHDLLIIRGALDKVEVGSKLKICDLVSLVSA